MNASETVGAAGVLERLERGLLEHVRERFGLPVATFSTDPGGHVSPGTKNLRAGGPGEKAESTWSPFM